jgi:hypothetical protein
LQPQLGFEEAARPLFDEHATGEAIMALVTDELTALREADSLVVFFAGQGATRTRRLGHEQIKTGYLIPVDGAVMPNRVNSWIQLDTWLRRVALLPPRHILVLIDACHSGIALAPVMRWRDIGAPSSLPLATLNARRSRRIITSALDDQRSLDTGCSSQNSPRKSRLQAFTICWASSVFATMENASILGRTMVRTCALYLSISVARSSPQIRTVSRPRAVTP